MGKIALDKYYTEPSLARYCWKVICDKIGLENITDVIEPSCGAGAFLMTAPCPISLAIDLEPELDELVDTTNKQQL